MSERGCHDFPSQLFQLTVPNKFVNDLFPALKNFWYWRTFLDMRGGAGRREEGWSIAISRQKTVSHKNVKLRKVTLPAFRKLLVTKSLMDKRGDGLSRLLVKYFWSHRPEELCMWTLLFFTNLLVSIWKGSLLILEIFWYRKALWTRWEMYCHGIPSKKLSQSTKKNVEEFFCFPD